MIKDNDILNIDWLIANHETIHYFGLGFIQLKLNQYQRFHFYTNRFGLTVQDEEIHNHRYNFTSRIIQGVLGQSIYEIEFGNELNFIGTHILTQESCNEDDKFEYPKLECLTVEVYKKLYRKGDSYYINHNTFHNVASTNAITFIERSGYKKHLADVVYKKDSVPVCPFSIKKTTDELFEIVRELIKKR